MWKLIQIRKAENKKHKWTAIFQDMDTKSVKRTNFGAAGYEDYTIHKDKSRRESYRKRHKKDLNTNDPTRAGYLSFYILWGDSTSMEQNIKIYRKKFKV